ncbi:carbamoyltransferase N-terminal domain-containing protein [Paraburkholderia sp. MM5482-R1]|uniref:carbamoyltransferase N-terminal domain-containing protein n=1 Tax=Paraburkholderia sp. MM5482-R1 TaxID=2991063 RepID=UPI003D2354D7
MKGAPYAERRADDLLASLDGSGLLVGGQSFPYKSYPHVSGHVASAYCTSPFAQSGQPAFCLVWDGGIVPRLYHVERHHARHVDCLFPVIGHIYAAAGHHFGPYKKPGGARWDLGVAGKLMAYIALGSVDEDIVEVFRELYQARFAGDTECAQAYRENIHSADASLAAVGEFFEASALRLEAKPPEDVLASFHVFLERLLVHEMGIALQRHSIAGPKNLCVAGGCGLNIKWNSALRASGLFDAIWVPPFPNDSGSAIGAACCALAAEKGFVPLEWSVYSGPALKGCQVPPGWTASTCSIAELASILASSKPVIFLAGRAELGPRALGGRSILAAATLPTMKDHLNDIKFREHFRPVAPICLEDRAPTIFSPGSPDPLYVVRSSDARGVARKNPCRRASRRICPIADHFKNFRASGGATSGRIRKADGYSVALQHERQLSRTRFLPGRCFSLCVGTRRTCVVRWFVTDQDWSFAVSRRNTFRYVAVRRLLTLQLSGQYDAVIVPAARSIATVRRRSAGLPWLDFRKHLSPGRRLLIDPRNLDAIF